MRQLADADRIARFMSAIGRAAEGETRVYFTGGATAVLVGWRESTIDVDLKLVPERDELLRALPQLKEELEINLELASPADFIPVPAGWEERSPFVGREGEVSFHHFDLTSQALSKIERGHAQDTADVAEMIARGLVEPDTVREHFRRIEPELYRFPAIDPAGFAGAVGCALGSG